MGTKTLILMIAFFLVANPATFKIMRGILGGWVASAEGLATPAGLILHAAVFVGLTIFLPRALMRGSSFALLNARQRADAAARRADRMRNRALKLERLVARELYEEEPEDYEEEPEEDEEGYAMMSNAARQAREERRAANYKARGDAAAAKLTAAGVPFAK